MAPADIITALAALVAAIGAIFIAYLSYKSKKKADSNEATLIRIGDAVFEVGQRVDGRLSDLLEATQAQARAEGFTAGETKERERG